jgi:hypothetical protein
MENIPAIETRLVSYRLMKKHIEEVRETMERGGNIEALRLRHAHESYMLYYYRNVRLEYTNYASVTIDGRSIAGAVRSLFPVGDMALSNAVDASVFYDLLLYTPVPFVFVPSSRLGEHSPLMSGVHEGKCGERAVLFMDSHSVGELELVEVVRELIYDPQVFSFYVGFIYG